MKYILIITLCIVANLAHALNDPLSSPVALSTYVKVKLHRLPNPDNQIQWENLQALKKELLFWEKEIALGKVIVSEATQKELVSWLVDVEQLDFRSPSDISTKKCQAIRGDFTFGHMQLKNKTDIPESSQWVLDALAKFCRMPELSYSQSAKIINFAADSDDEAAAVPAAK